MDTVSEMTSTELEKYFETTSKCPLCNSENLIDFFKINKLNFNECKLCHFRFMNPYLSNQGMRILYENSETLSQINPALERYYEYQTNLKISRTLMDYKKVLEFVSKKLPSSASKPKLFEVGYGNGSFLLEAIRSGWEVDGIETSKQNSESLKKEYGLNVQCGTFDDFEPPRERYQMVALWDVIEHTMHPRPYVKKAYDMLVPGGLLVLSTPNISGLLNQVAERLYFLSMGRIKSAIKQLYVFEHVGYYTPQTLGRLVSMEEFEIKKKIFAETDLERYEFSPVLKLCLWIFFFIAKLMNRQNRMILIAQKKIHGS